MSINTNRKPTTGRTKTAKSGKTINIADYQGTERLDRIQENALQEYEVGRAAIYKAIALTYIWYELSKDNEAYLAEAFASFANQTNSHVYVKAVKACLRLDLTLQAPTISKYTTVLKYLHKQHGNTIIKGADAATIALLTKTIRDAGGLDGCVRAYRGKEQAPNGEEKRRLTKQEVESRAEDYLSEATRPLANFRLPKDFQTPESKLLIMIGRVSAGKAEVIDVAANDKLVDSFIRAK